MASRVRALVLSASFVAGAILYGIGVLGFADGSCGGYYAGTGNPSLWWPFAEVLLAAAVLVSGGLAYSWHLRNGPAVTTRRPRWGWGSLVVPLFLMSLGVAAYLTAPLCLPPPGILWPTY